MSIKQYLHHLNRRDTKILSKPKISRLSKFCLVFLVLISSIYLVKVIKAQNIIEQVQTAQTKGNNAESWHKNALEATSVTMVNSLVGNITFKDGKVQPQGFVPGGMIGLTNNMIASLFTPPASGIEYIAQVKNQFLGGNPVYAQGAGFVGLQPILPLWRGFRNVVYILSALVFVIIGLMIMLRIKISPQAVITIQSAIPQIITSLILVTFSYAIAGLLIDLMSLFQTLAIAIIFNAQGVSLNGGTIGGYDFNKLQSVGFWDLFSLIYKVLPMYVVGGLSLLVGGSIGAIMATPAAAAAAAGTVAAPATLAVVVGIGIGTVILFIVFLLIIVITLIKLFFGLAKCYLNIILKIIFAPLEIGLGAIPNMKIGFSSWLIDLIANLAVFPIITIFIIIVNILVQDYNSTLWVPSLISGFTWTIKAAIGFSALFLIAQLPQLIPQAIFQLKPSPFGQAIGEGFKTMPGRSTAEMVLNETKAAGLQGATESMGYRISEKAGQLLTRRRARGAIGSNGP